MDSSNDSWGNLQVCLDPEIKTDFIIMRNLHKETPESCLTTDREGSSATVEREGKAVYRGHQMVELEGIDRPVRLVYKVTERTMLRNGQFLLIPEIELETYWTTLPDSLDDIIANYHHHGTSEQFNSEIKINLDLERLPSGKFATNNHKKVQRRRLHTVIQNLITIA